MIRAGLSDDEADHVLDRLREELGADKLHSESERYEFIEGELAQIKAKLDTQPKPPGRVETITVGFIGGLLTNAVYDAIKAELAGRTTQIIRPSPERPEEVIQVQWAGIPLSREILQCEDAIRRVLTCHESKHGSYNRMTALYLDGIATFESAKGNRRKAETLRQQALKISRRVNGPVCESTANVWSNLSLDLFHRRGYNDADRALVRAFTTIRQSVGDSHPSTAGVVYNAYYIFNLQGRIPPSPELTKFRRLLPQVREFGKVMSARKNLILLLLALKDSLAEIARLRRSSY